MKKNILAICVVILVVVMLSFSISAGAKNEDQLWGKPFQAIWEAIFGLQSQIDDLEARVSALEGQGPPTECTSGDTRSCYTGPPETEDVGECQAGTESCVNDEWSGVCEGDVTPTPEVCDGLDNDCDGTNDNGVSALCNDDIDCTSDVCFEGGCLSTPNHDLCYDDNQCTDDICDLESGCMNPPIAPGTPCDDGNECTVNDFCSNGVCAGGIPVDCDDGNPCTTDSCNPVGGCVFDVVAGALCDDGNACTEEDTCQEDGTCVGEPGQEICDGIDNDCDGNVDEGDPGGGGSCNTGQPGICAAGTEHCVSGSIQCVPDNSPSSEVCDGLDNDCDEGTPDGSGESWYGNPCDGLDSDLCEEGNYMCSGGSQACTDNDAEHDVEVCDGVDNDCDGGVDNGPFDDSSEPNDNCISVTTLATVGSNQLITYNDKTLYPAGDNDYWRINAVESDSTCQCCDFCTDEDYQLEIHLTVPPGAGSYRFCTGDSCANVNEFCQTVLSGQTGTWTWTLDGACPANDAYDRYVRIYGSGAPGYECEPYTLSYSFTPGCF